MGSTKVCIVFDESEGGIPWRKSYPTTTTFAEEPVNINLWKNNLTAHCIKEYTTDGGISQDLNTLGLPDSIQLIGLVRFKSDSKGN